MYIQRNISGRCNQAYKSLAGASAEFLFFRLFLPNNKNGFLQMLTHITITYWIICIHEICEPKPYNHENFQSRLSQTGVWAFQ